MLQRNELLKFLKIEVMDLCIRWLLVLFKVCDNHFHGLPSFILLFFLSFHLQSRANSSMVTSSVLNFSLYSTAGKIIQSKTFHMNAIVYFYLQFIRRQVILYCVKTGLVKNPACHSRLYKDKKCIRKRTMI